jgi:hypothetical protein
MLNFYFTYHVDLLLFVDLYISDAIYIYNIKNAIFKFLETL